VKKKTNWFRSISVCLLIGAVMIGAGYYLVSAENGLPPTIGSVEASLHEQADLFAAGPGDSNENAGERTGEETAAGNEIETEEEAGVQTEESGEEANDQEGEHAAENDAGSGSADGHSEQAASDQTSTSEDSNGAEINEAQPEATEEQTASEPVETITEQPTADPEPEEEPADESEEEPADEPEEETVSPVTYAWGTPGNYTFRIEVQVTNQGSASSRNVRVSVPMLENKSPYQTTNLKSVNYNEVSSSGRVSTFNIGDLEPGESKTIVADFNIEVQPVSINSTNETVEKAYEAYKQYAGNGNCRELARGFINKSREMGLDAREVVGFARPQRGDMTSGSLQGSRHSWAEFYVDDLGWVPVDLTFQYFGELPHTSHIIEGYGDQSIQVNYNGGSLSASWSNSIL